MWIESCSGLLINLDEIREIGSSRPYNLGDETSPHWVYDLVAFGVGRNPIFSDENRYLMRHASSREVHRGLERLADAIRDGRSYHSFRPAYLYRQAPRTAVDASGAQKG
jgi:hypothetical protein